MRKITDKTEIETIMNRYKKGDQALTAPMWGENGDVLSVYIYDNAEEQKQHWYYLKNVYESKLVHGVKIDGGHLYIYNNLDDLDSSSINYDKDQLDKYCYIRDELPGNAPSSNRYNIGIKKQRCSFCGMFMELNPNRKS